jgi:uncharacterized membrane protein
MITTKAYRIIIAFFAITIGLYPCIYFLNNYPYGLLHSKSDELLSSIVYNTGFYTHISFGGLALLIGWLQFLPKLRKRYWKLHRQTGRVYVIATSLSAVAAIYIAVYARGGIIATLGFIGLGLTWLYTTLRAYINIKNKQITQHQKMMTYSYAACFAAVTLRVYLPLLTLLLHDLTTAYLIVAWLCWLPNLIVAYFITRRLKYTKAATAVTELHLHTKAKLN